MIYSEFPTYTLSVLDFLPGTHFSTKSYPFFLQKSCFPYSKGLDHNLLLQEIQDGTVPEALVEGLKAMLEDEPQSLRMVVVKALLGINKLVEEEEEDFFGRNGGWCDCKHII